MIRNKKFYHLTILTVTLNSRPYAMIINTIKKKKKKNLQLIPKVQIVREIMNFTI